MFRYFPTNYVWNLSVDLAIEMGARMGEIEDMCAPLRRRRASPTRKAPAPFANLGKMADKLCDLAAKMKAARPAALRGRQIQRAASTHDGRTPASARRARAHGSVPPFLDTFQRGIALAGENCERVEIPYGEGHFSGLLVKAQQTGARARCWCSSTAWIRPRK
jgi:hypothetical protein